MQRTITPTDMREMERAFMEGTGYPSLLLMEHAAQAVAEAITRMIPHGALAAFVCGGGNNGGDGFAAARLYKAMGGRVQVISLEALETLRGDAMVNARLLQAMDVEIEVGVEALTQLEPESALIVDAILGTGLSRDVRGDYAVAISQIAQSGLPVLSVDIPSGIDGATGAVRGCAVKAERTVTFHRPKNGHFLFPGRAHTGVLTVEIGRAHV